MDTNSMSVRHLSEALVAGLLLASAAANQTSSGCTAHPLSRVVAEVRARDVGVLQALLQLGRENAICFGIESVEKQSFQPKVDLDARNELGLDVIKRVLSGRRGRRPCNHFGPLWIILSRWK